MSSLPLPARIRDLVSRSPGLTDRELADALLGAGSAQQPVNQACRRLEGTRVLVRRMRDDGLIGNFPHDGAEEMALPPAPEAGVFSEDWIKAKLKDALEAEGWSVRVAWGHARGVDVTATRGSERLLIEVKGIGAHAQARGNYFLHILGATLQRMDDEAASYGIALPDHPQFRGLWSRLPPLARRRTGIRAWFVGEDGRVSVSDGQG